MRWWFIRGGRGGEWVSRGRVRPNRVELSRETCTSDQGSSFFYARSVFVRSRSPSVADAAHRSVADRQLPNSIPESTLSTITLRRRINGSLLSRRISSRYESYVHNPRTISNRSRLAPPITSFTSTKRRRKNPTMTSRGLSIKKAGEDSKP